MTELLIIYDLQEKNCVLESRDRINKRYGGILPASKFIVEKIKLRSKKDFRKALRLACSVRKAYRAVRASNLSW